MKLEHRGEVDVEKENDSTTAPELARAEHDELDAAQEVAPGLRAWTDELPCPPEQRREVEPAVQDQQQGIVLDFLADTSVAIDTDEGPPAGSDDADFFFSAARKRALEEEGLVSAAELDPEPEPEPGPAPDDSREHG